MNTVCPRCSGRLLLTTADDDPSCLACGWSGPTRPAEPIVRVHTGQQQMTQHEQSALRVKVDDLLGDGPHTVRQIAERLRADRRHIDKVLASGRDDGLWEVCGMDGRARLFRRKE